MTRRDRDQRVRDQADVIAGYWSQENPDLDALEKTLAIRLRRAAHHIEHALRRELASQGIDLFEMEVLFGIRRSPGHAKAIGELLKESYVTSGAITNRVARLEEKGWVRRDADPADRRQVIVTLTKEGMRRANQLVKTKTETEDRVFSGLDRRTMKRMADDLRTLMLSLEAPVSEQG